MNEQAIAVNDEDDPSQSQMRLGELRQKEPTLVREDMTAEILMATDDKVVTTASLLTDENILEEAIIEEIEADDGLDELDGDVTIPNVREVEGALEILRNFSVFIDKRKN